MSRLALVLAILVVTLVGCGSTPPQGSPTSPSPAVSPSTPPTEAPATGAPPSEGPTERPSPSAPPAATPSPAESPAVVEPTAEEQQLLAGVRSDLVDCRPLRRDLPPLATGAIECRSDDPAVARVGLFLFDGTADMLAAYYARMDAEGVQRNSVACEVAEGESAYIPGEEELDSRHGCFVNDQGYANYRATVPGHLLYIGVLGRTGDMRSLADFAWRGNQDTPGSPTLWSEPAG